jgi:hypothetical protein
VNSEIGPKGPISENKEEALFLLIKLETIDKFSLEIEFY